LLIERPPLDAVFYGLVRLDFTKQKPCQHYGKRKSSMKSG
jgi:hypothetical protein